MLTSTVVCIIRHQGYLTPLWDLSFVLDLAEYTSIFQPVDSSFDVNLEIMVPYKVVHSLEFLGDPLWRNSKLSTAFIDFSSP